MAEEIPWTSEPIERVYQQKDLRELLRELAVSQRIVANVDEEVSGTVFGKFNMPPGELFQYLVSTYGLVDYYAANVLYVYPASSMISEVVSLRRVDPSQVIRTLTEMGVSDDRYPIKVSRRERALIASGSRQFVDMVKQVAKAVDENQTGRIETEVRVFQLKYAWASDYVFRQGNREYVVPGVATVLRRLFPAQSQRSSRPASLLGTAAAQEPVYRRVPDSDVTLRLPPKMPDPQAFELDDTAPAGGPKPGDGDFDFPQFTPDGRLNAVLIRDLPIRMPLYAQLLRTLDVRAMLVEIEAKVIEVSSDDFRTLGVDWRITGGEVDARSGRDDLPTQRPPGTELPPADGIIDTLPRGGALASAGGTLTTILSDGGRSLVARINALARDGKASFRAVPKVLTLDNVEAVLERLRTFFVRVPGTYSTDLFDISVGTSLRVTPLVVEEGQNKVIKLSVKIEDGEITDQRVDQIPIITRNTIGTQVFLNQGESLLIAGYTEDVEREVEAGVPGLSKIPLLGYLFKQRDTTAQRIERLFMITPRLVVATPAAGTAAITEVAATRLPPEPAAVVRAPTPPPEPAAVVAVVHTPPSPPEPAAVVRTPTPPPEPAAAVRTPAPPPEPAAVMRTPAHPAAVSEAPATALAHQPSTANPRPAPPQEPTAAAVTSAVNATAATQLAATIPPPMLPPAPADAVRTPARWDTRGFSQPPYPSKARRERQQGTVILFVYILKDGSVSDVRVHQSSGFPLLDKAAVSHARLGRMIIPTREGEEPVARWSELSVTFRLSSEMG